LLNLQTRRLLQACRQRLHRRLLQGPGDLRQVLHGRRRLRQVLQEVSEANSHRRGDFRPGDFFYSRHEWK